MGKIIRFRRRLFRSRRARAALKRAPYVVALFLALLAFAYVRVGDVGDSLIGSISDGIASLTSAKPRQEAKAAAEQNAQPESLPTVQRGIDDSKPEFLPRRTSRARRNGRERCRAPLPLEGESFRGVVTDVLDGDGICVGTIRGGVEVRLGDFRAPELDQPGGREAKAALERIAIGRTVDCVAGGRSYDRVVSLCTLGGEPLGDLMRAARIKEGGK